MNPRCRLLRLFSIRAPASRQLELAIIYPPTLTTVLLAQRKQPYPVCASWCRGFRCPFRGIWGPKYVLCRCEKEQDPLLGCQSFHLAHFGDPPQAALPRLAVPQNLVAWHSYFLSLSGWTSSGDPTSSMSNGSYLKSLQPPFCSGSLMGLRNNEASSSGRRYPQ